MNHREKGIPRLLDTSHELVQMNQQVGVKHKVLLVLRVFVWLARICRQNGLDRRNLVVLAVLQLILFVAILNMFKKFTKTLRDGLNEIGLLEMKTTALNILQQT